MAEDDLAWAKLNETPMQLYISQHISQVRERLVLEPGVCLGREHATLFAEQEARWARIVAWFKRRVSIST